MKGSETRLEHSENVIIVQERQKFGRDSFFQDFGKERQLREGMKVTKCSRVKGGLLKMVWNNCVGYYQWLNRC